MEHALITRFKDAYSDMVAMDLSRLDQLYSSDLVFRDPIHEIRGLAAMQDYMAAMVSTVQECRFEFLDELVSVTTGTHTNSAYIKWNMHFRHPKLGGKLLTVRGITQLQFTDRITYHEDVYDMGAMVYEHVPFIGAITRWLKQRLTS